MESIAVTKPNMGVLSRLMPSPFGVLAQVFSQQLLARAGYEAGIYPYVPMELLEEAAPGAVGTVRPAVQVDLRLVLEAPRKAESRESYQRAVERTVERVIRVREKGESSGRRQRAGAPSGGPESVLLQQNFYHTLQQHIHFAASLAQLDAQRREGRPALPTAAPGVLGRRAAEFAKQRQALEEGAGKISSGRPERGAAAFPRQAEAGMRAFFADRRQVRFILPLAYFKSGGAQAGAQAASEAGADLPRDADRPVRRRGAELAAEISRQFIPGRWERRPQTPPQESTGRAAGYEIESSTPETARAAGRPDGIHTDRGASPEARASRMPRQGSGSAAREGTDAPAGQRMPQQEARPRRREDQAGPEKQAAEGPRGQKPETVAAEPPRDGSGLTETPDQAGAHYWETENLRRREDFGQEGTRPGAGAHALASAARDIRTGGGAAAEPGPDEDRSTSAAASAVAGEELRYRVEHVAGREGRPGDPQAGPGTSGGGPGRASRHAGTSGGAPAAESAERNRPAGADTLGGKAAGRAKVEPADKSVRGEPPAETESGAGAEFSAGTEARAQGEHPAEIKTGPWENLSAETGVHAQGDFPLALHGRRLASAARDIRTGGGTADEPGSDENRPTAAAAAAAAGEELRYRVEHVAGREGRPGDSQAGPGTSRGGPVAESAERNRPAGAAVLGGEAAGRAKMEPADKSVRGEPPAGTESSARAESPAGTKARAQGERPSEIKTGPRKSLSAETEVRAQGDFPLALHGRRLVSAARDIRTGGGTAAEPGPDEDRPAAAAAAAVAGEELRYRVDLEHVAGREGRPGDFQADPGTSGGGPERVPRHAGASGGTPAAESAERNRPAGADTLGGKAAGRAKVERPVAEDKSVRGEPPAGTESGAGAESPAGTKARAQGERPSEIKTDPRENLSAETGVHAQGDFPLALHGRRLASAARDIRTGGGAAAEPGPDENRPAAAAAAAVAGEELRYRVEHVAGREGLPGDSQAGPGASGGGPERASRHAEASGGAPAAGSAERNRPAGADTLGGEAAGRAKMEPADKSVRGEPPAGTESGARAESSAGTEARTQGERPSEIKTGPQENLSAETGVHAQGNFPLALHGRRLAFAARDIRTARESRAAFERPEPAPNAQTTQSVGFALPEELAYYAGPEGRLPPEEASRASGEEPAGGQTQEWRRLIAAFPQAGQSGALREGMTVSEWIRSVHARQNTRAEARDGQASQPPGNGQEAGVEPERIELAYGQPSAGGMFPPRPSAMEQRLPPSGAGYFDSLPEWTKRFFRENGVPESNTAARNIGMAPNLAAPDGREPGPDGGWTSRSLAARPPAQLSYRESARESGPFRREVPQISEAEIQRAANRVYQLIEDRIRWERRRLGL